MARRRKKHKVVKPNGSIQRADTSLSRPIAIALMQMILSGESLFPSQGYLQLDIGEEKPVELLCSTLNSWVSRDNVIPETGKTLREFLNDARREYRNIKREQQQQNLLDEAEGEFRRIMAMRSSQPVRNMFGQLVYDDKSKTKLARRENVGILRLKIEAAKYLTERLDPQRYGKVEKTENKHLVFSLADLRRAKQQQDQEREAAKA